MLDINSNVFSANEGFVRLGKKEYLLDTKIEHFFDYFFK